MEPETPKTKKRTAQTSKRVPVLRFPKFSGEWEGKRLGDTGEIVTGTTPPTKNRGYYGGKIPWVTPTDITMSKNIQASERSLTEEGLKKGRKIPMGSLLVTCIASIGKNAILRIDGSCNQQINAIIPNSENDVDFLYYLLERKKNILIQFAGAGGMQMLNKKDFSHISFLFPSVSEQKEIAEFLGSVDEWIETLRAQKKSLESYKKGVMQKIFSPHSSPPVRHGEGVSSLRDGGVEALTQKENTLSKTKLRFKDQNGNDFPEWEEKRLGEIFSITTGISKSKYISEEGNNIIVDMGGVSSEGFLLAKKKTMYKKDFLKEGDLVMPKDDIGGGLIIGRVAIIPEGKKYILGDHVYKLSLKGNCLAKYFFYMINSFEINKAFRKKANGTAQLGLSKKEVEDQFVFVPCFTEQKQIAEFLSGIDEKISSLSAKLASAQKFKKGLMQKMFV